MKLCDYMSTDWFKSLQAEVSKSTVTAVAVQMGICRPKLAQVLNGSGLYGSGKASTAKIEAEYRRTFEQITCTFNSKQVSIAHCREHALRPAPTHNPRLMMQWQSCQTCPNKPKPIAFPKTKKQTKVSTKEDTQQAGIIDKVTLPLPEVGGPQINQEAV